MGVSSFIDPVARRFFEPSLSRIIGSLHACVLEFVHQQAPWVSHTLVAPFSSDPPETPAPAESLWDGLLAFPFLIDQCLVAFEENFALFPPCQTGDSATRLACLKEAVSAGLSVVMSSLDAHPVSPTSRLSLKQEVVSDSALTDYFTLHREYSLFVKQKGVTPPRPPVDADASRDRAFMGNFETPLASFTEAVHAHYLATYRDGPVYSVFDYVPELTPSFEYTCSAGIVLDSWSSFDEPPDSFVDSVPSFGAALSMPF